MKQYRITFTDIVSAQSEEDAYNALLDYMKDCVKYHDVTCFDFEEVSEEPHEMIH